MSKKKIAVLFGGQSSEHVVSCVSAANVIDQIDKEKYDLLLIGITEEGHRSRQTAWRTSALRRGDRAGWTLSFLRTQPKSAP